MRFSAPATPPGPLPTGDRLAVVDRRGLLTHRHDSAPGGRAAHTWGARPPGVTSSVENYDRAETTVPWAIAQRVSWSSCTEAPSRQTACRLPTLLATARPTRTAPVAGFK